MPRFMKVSEDGKALEAIIRKSPKLPASDILEQNERFQKYGLPTIRTHVSEFKKRMEEEKDDDFDKDIKRAVAKRSVYSEGSDSEYSDEEPPEPRDQSHEPRESRETIVTPPHVAPSSRLTTGIQIHESNPPIKTLKFFCPVTKSTHFIVTACMHSGVVKIISVKMVSNRKLEITYIWPQCMTSSKDLYPSLYDKNQNQDLVIAADMESMKSLQHYIGERISSTISVVFDEDIDRSKVMVDHTPIENNANDPNSWIVVVEVMAVSDEYHLQDQEVDLRDVKKSKTCHE